MAQDAGVGGLSKRMPNIKLGIGFDDDDDPNHKKKAQQQANHEQTQNMTLYTACAEGFLSIVVLNWAQGCDLNQPDEQGYTCLMWAALQGKIQIIRFLLDQGCPINYAAPDGQTALMWAATENHLAAGKLLVEMGADPCQVDRNGYNSYFISVHHGHLHFLHLLHLLKPVDPNVTDNDGHHLTTWACYKGELELLEYCHEILGVPMTGKDNMHRTALHWCAREGWTECVRYCISKGLPTTEKDDDGQSPLDYAKTRFHEFSLKVIEQKQGSQEQTCIGTMALLTSNKAHMLNSVLAILYFIIHYNWTHWIIPFWAHVPTSFYGGKNMFYAFLRNTPVRHSVPETTLIEDIGAPKTVMQALRGPMALRRREISNLFGLASLLATQYYAAISTGVPLHWAWMPLLVAFVIFGFLAKMNPFKNVVEPQSIKDDPSLVAVEKGEYHQLHPRVFDTKKHVRIPLRAFYCLEIDRIVKRYDSWSVMLDTPITNQNHRSFFFCIVCFTLLQLVTLIETYNFMSEKYCEDGHQYQVSRVAWNLMFSNLPCAMKPLSDSWLDWFLPQPHNWAGVWLISYVIPTFLFSAAVVGRNLATILQGVSRAEAIDRTAPTVNGDMESIARSDGTFVYSDGVLVNVMMWLTGRSGARWNDAVALPTTTRPSDDGKGK